MLMHRMPFARGRLRTPWAFAFAVAVPLVAAYLIAAPPAADLAAATYRSDLFARVGFTTWDTGWYAAHGHWLPGYSLLSPALGALLGVRPLLALSALAASALFGVIAARAFGGGGGARLAAAWFALGICVGMLSGRVPYDLGVAIGLAAVLALTRSPLPLSLALAALTSLASPVAGAFLALAGLAGAVGLRLANTGLGLGSAPAPPRTREAPRSEHPTPPPPAPAASGGPTGASALRCLLLAAAALTPLAILGIAYPEGGYEPFAPSAFWPALAGVALIALLLPQGPLTPRAWRALRAGAALYALALVGAYAIHTPLGGNAARLGPLLGAPLLAGVLWEGRRRTLLLLCPALLYWQLVTPLRDYAHLASDPSVHASYYAPLRAELERLTGGAPAIVEVPLTKAHWEAAYLPYHDGVSLARGWERQLDTRYAPLFYRPALTAPAYRAWLAENHVAYVALPDAPLDAAGREEGNLIARGLPYLRPLWRSPHWRLYRFMG
jgi:hypothetical protein